MKFRLSCAMLAVALAAAPGLVQGAEPVLEFLSGLQQRGYGEAALDYIDVLAARKDTPVAVRQVFDLERSKSLKVAANEAYNLEQKNQRIAESEKLLEKFLKEFPDHPAAAPALLGQADTLLEQAQMSLGLSRATRVDAEKAELCKKAREQFTEAAGQLTQIEKKLKTRIDGLPPVPPNGKPTAQRLDWEYALLETRFKLALIEYSTSLTYLNEKDPERKKILQKATKSFDAVFQLHRGTRAGILAHMWNGKVLEELGDEENAMEVYDEVLVNSPADGKRASEDDARLFGQAALFRFQLMIRKNELVEMQNEAAEWLKLNRSWEKTAPYSGIAVALAKSHIEAAGKAGAVEPRKRYQAAAAILLPITKVDSEYKHEALLLRRECQEKLGAQAGASTPDEEIALGDAAVAEKEWAEAQSCYERALKLAETAKNDKAIATAKQKLTQIRYQLAVQSFGKKEYEEALKAAGAIVATAGDDPVAITASGLAIASALELYAAAPADTKPKVLERLERIAKYTIDKWPDRAEADDARMSLARASLIRNEEDGAITQLELVNARSPRYGMAQQVVGQITWKRYLTLKKQLSGMPAPVVSDDPDAKVTPEMEEQKKKYEDAQKKLAELLPRARKSFKESLLQLKQVAKTDPERADAGTIADVQLLLAESSLEEKLPGEAAPLFAELVKQIEAKKPTEIDKEIQRTFIGAVRSQILSGQVEVGGATALSLINLSTDNAALNAVLIDFSRLVAAEVKKADAEVTRLKSEKPRDLDARKPAETTLASTQKVLGEMLTKLSDRKELSIPSLVYLGDTAVNLKQSKLANTNYQRALARIDKPEPGDDVASGAKASTRIRAQLISILRSEGKFAEANKQVDALVAAHPNSLEPKMEKGRILQSWAESDPSRFDECVTHWATLRVLLGRLKQRPAEYYEVLYNCADCLLKQSLAQKDPTKALEGEKILKSTLVLTPNLNGPDTVANYKALMVQLATAAKQAPGPKPAVTTNTKTGTTAPETTPPKTGTTPAKTPEKTGTTPVTTTPPKTGTTPATTPPKTGTTPATPPKTGTTPATPPKTGTTPATPAKPTTPPATPAKPAAPKTGTTPEKGKTPAKTDPAKTPDKSKTPEKAKPK
ncbi:tetratricopeptide repeat protein [Anatilimnocola floriformis]|uniref:tetratricopeptide repeat protein n=1 Tax=Anatilimnocola floriformis TaxID=2948575 RepID=UPI0020C2F83F|nr:tetratricopeptide repeat protein [Anatilimnocola floriformis]